MIAQDSDVDNETKFGVKWDHGITQEEATNLNSQSNNVEREIPQQVLDAIHQARLENNIDEVVRLTDLMYLEYRPEVRKITSENLPSFDLPVPIVGDFTGSFEYDWLDNDVMVSADTGGANQFNRTLDLKRGDDGALYLAHIVNTSTQRRIRVSKSTDGGQTWQIKGGILYQSLNNHFETLSMLVESKSASVDDSIRVIVYYTYAADNNNDDAKLGYFQFKPNDPSFAYDLKILDSPSTGREFNYVSAISDGQYWQNNTYLGCIVGEYSNNSDTTISHRLFQTRDWGATHSSVTINSGYNEFYPNADFLEGISDSVVFVTQRHFSTPGDEVRVMFTPWSTLSSSIRTVFLTIDTLQYEKPRITIKQGGADTDKKIVITCTKDGRARYHGSSNSGVTWNTDYTLDPNINYSTNFTYITSDSTGTSGDFCAMFSRRGTGDDSINVRRGTLGSMGTTVYKQNAMEITSTHPAVTVIYRNGGTLESAFAYWGNGPYGIYYDAEHLVTNVTDLPGTVDKYQLAQNYPNPFNPSTVIRFSVPEQANVTLKIFNSIGQEVATLLNGEISAGNHQVDFNASALSSGIYFYQISSANFTATKKMILIK
ncbi:MAG TPA: T9SS type A sorting domain-containing protein [Ignavibacteriaceae bacterium]|nr:T9SS type A sorting domain-containing protein [Ignavibacteriaceae bacterium]